MCQRASTSRRRYWKSPTNRFTGIIFELVNDIQTVHPIPKM